MSVRNKDSVGKKFILSLEHLPIKLTSVKNVDKNFSSLSYLDVIETFQLLLVIQCMTHKVGDYII